MKSLILYTKRCREKASIPMLLKPCKFSCLLPRIRVQGLGFSKTEGFARSCKENRGFKGIVGMRRVFGKRQ